MLRKLGIYAIQFVWFWGKPLFHWWAYPPDYSGRLVFHGKPIMWRLAIGFCEIRIFPFREGLPYDVYTP